ncbi:hypothetical protein KPH14_009151 [Odynerus spinipes]|uniref:Uncharacterized protein n=1 Tax=Odynerus spinipes TaxID=1348599 RepID=A0AAD9RNP2_9HYME|nr:hypothetical protein KPH14_009151 [Odynerus spinipes]
MYSSYVLSFQETEDIKRLKRERNSIIEIFDVTHFNLRASSRHSRSFSIPHSSMLGVRTTQISKQPGRQASKQTSKQANRQAKVAGGGASRQPRIPEEAR